MKHDLPIMSTDRGIQIVCNIQFAKHDWAIIVRFDPPSDLTTILQLRAYSVCQTSGETGLAKNLDISRDQ
jgi:hypothetical protein